MRGASGQSFPLQPCVGQAVFSLGVTAGCSPVLRWLLVATAAPQYRAGHLCPGQGFPAQTHTHLSKWLATSQVSDSQRCLGELVLSEVLGTAALWVGLLSKWESLTLVYLKSLITSCLKLDIANLWILVTLIFVPCCRICQVRMIQRGLLVLWGEKSLVYLQ